ncbi:MAG: glycosyltransferase family 4 protein [Candidatus Nitrosocaldus sp.]
MKILATTPYFYPEGGGLERYSYNIFKRLVAKGHKIDVYCATRQGYDSKEELDGIIVNRLKPDLIISNTPIRYNLYSILERELDRNSYDLINSHTPVPYFAEITSLVAAKKKIDYILTYHAPVISTSILLNIISNILRITIDKHMMKIAKKIITVNDICTYTYLNKYIDKTVVIPPGVDINRYKPNSYNAYGKRLLFIGSLTLSYKYKGLRVLLDSLPLVVKYHPDVKLVIIGDGPLKKEYMNLCKLNNIDKNVMFRGRVSEEELISEYQNSTLLIVPTLTDTEGFGMVSLEANACGIPVIASRIGGIPYYVKDGINGSLVEPRNSKALADKIIKLLDNPKLLEKLSSDCRERALEFGWDKVTNMTEKLFLMEIR